MTIILKDIVNVVKKEKNIDPTCEIISKGNK